MRRPSRRHRSKRTLTSLYPGVQVWLLQRLKLSAEYGFHNAGRNDFGSVQLEVAF